MRTLEYTALGVALFISAAHVHAENSPESLMGLSLEQLLNIPIATRHYAEELNKAPRPFSVYTSNTLQANQIESVYDLALLVPNFSFHKNFGRYQERPVIRGVSTLVGEPPVGILLDGVSVSNVVNTLPMHSLERVEVLRGPEAALYGRANFAGAVNFIYKRPTQTNSLVVGNRTSVEGYSELHLEANIALTAASALMLTGVYHDRPNHIDNKVGELDKGYGEERSSMLSLAGSWDLSDHLQLYYRGATQSDGDGHIPTYLQNSDSNNCYLDTPQQYYCGELKAPSHPGYNSTVSPWALTLDNTLSRHHLEAAYSQEGYDIKVTVARSDVSGKAGFDGDLYELDRAYSQLIKESADTTIQAISNIYMEDSRLLVGVSKFTQSAFSQTLNAFNFGGNVSVSEGAALSTGVDNFSIFASFDTLLPAGVKVNADLRYAEDTIDYRSITSETVHAYSGENSWKSWSPRVNLSKQVDDNWLTYVSVSKGRKPGGFNNNLEPLSFESEAERQRVLQFLTYEEEVLLSYELGVKGALITDTLFLNAGVFYYDLKDLQLNQSLSYTNDASNNVRVTSTINGGRATNMGFEAEVEAVLTSNLSARFNLGYTQTKLRDTETTAQFDLTGDASVNKNQIPNAPNMDIFSGLYYHRELPNHVLLKVNSTLAYESERYVAEHNLASVGEFYRVNVMLSAERNAWRVSLWGKNLNNDTTPESAARFGDAASFFRTRAFGISMADERQIGVGVSLQY